MLWLIVMRSSTAWSDIGPQPTYIGDDLNAIADQLIDRYPASATVAGGATH